MKRQKFLLLIIMALSFSCKSSKEKHGNDQAYKCLENKIPVAFNIFNSIDSILIKEKIVEPLNTNSYIDVLYSLKSKKLLINPWDMYEKPYDPMNFFSPANYDKIKVLVF